MAQHLLSDLVSYFTIDEINIDDWTFKLYYKASTILCILGASVGVAQAYFGKPISCSFNGVDADLANDFCWMHGGGHMAPQYQANIILKTTETTNNEQVKLGCITQDLSDDTLLSDEYSAETQYYQWVTFMFFLQVIIT